MKIEYACSLGPFCHSANILKQNNLKECSYPFDWIFSNNKNIIHCIKNKFNIFLNKAYYTNISNNRCGHLYYNKDLFRHHNPLINENDYNYLEKSLRNLGWKSYLESLYFEYGYDHEFLRKIEEILKKIDSKAYHIFKKIFDFLSKLEPISKSHYGDDYRIDFNEGNYGYTDQGELKCLDI